MNTYSRHSLPGYWLALVLSLMALACPLVAQAQFSLNISVNVAPPELPVYTQPPIPAEGWLWTPGYWAYSQDVGDYYWVPGTWVTPPQPGYLWTPGYWGFEGGLYGWHAGYWGTQVGFYGGVNYGFGYGGAGYEGGYWRDNHLYYNTSVNNVSNTHITNVYQKTVINNVTVTHTSYNGGNGIQARPTAQELAVARAPHLEATPAQVKHLQVAQRDPSLRQSVNGGHPAVAATARPGEFSGRGVVAARGAAPRAAAEQRSAPAAAREPERAPREAAAAPREAPAAPREAPAAPREAAPREAAPRAEAPARAAPPAPRAPPAPAHPNPPREAPHPPEHPDHEH